MNVQPTPSADCMPRAGASHGPGRVPAFAPAPSLAASQLVPWPLELEVEPWRP